MKKHLLILTLIALTACARPEGPAERLGRSIDDLSNNLSDLSKEWDGERARPAENDSERENKRKRYREADDGLLDPQ